MSTFKKLLLLQAWLFVVLPVLGAMFAAGGLAGNFVFNWLVVLWFWELFAASHYRYCRQQEFLYVLQTAGATQAPVESVLRAYLEDRPREILYRSMLLFFVFPGYYWIHRRRSFDFRLGQLTDLLESGVPLSHAFALVPGVVSRESALAITVGQFGGGLTESLARLPDRRLAPQWLEMATRLAYPLLILLFLCGNVGFLMIFIVPKFEKIFLEFRMKLPFETEVLVAVSRWFINYPYVLAIWALFLLVFINLLIASSRVKWHTPVVGWFYRMYARGQFLQTLGLMLETGKPLPRILDGVLDSGLLPTVVAQRAERLAQDLYEGQPLAESLAKHGLATGPMTALIVSAEKANNLAWALQELGDSLIRRSGRICHRLAMVLFPLGIFAIAALIGAVAISMFSPLVALIEGMK